MQLKKGSLWGNKEPGRETPPPPPLGVVGQSLSDGPTPRSGSNGGIRPPESPTSLPKEGSSPGGGGMSSAGSEKSTGSKKNGRLSAGGPASDSGTANVSNVMLTLDAPMQQRRLVSSIPLPPHQQATTPTLRNSNSNIAMNAYQASTGMGMGSSPIAMRIDDFPTFPVAEPPSGMARGGSEELSWLREQLADGQKIYQQIATSLQRVQQESVAIRSSLLAQQQNDQTLSFRAGERGSEEGSERDESPTTALRDGSPRPPGTLRKQGTGNNLIVGLSGGAKPMPGQKDRQQRKRGGLGLATGGDEEMEGGDEEDVVHAHPKPEAIQARMLATLSTKAPFDGHEEMYLQQLIAAMAPVAVNAGMCASPAALHLPTARTRMTLPLTPSQTLTFTHRRRCDHRGRRWRSRLLGRGGHPRGPRRRQIGRHDPKGHRLRRGRSALRPISDRNHPRDDGLLDVDPTQALVPAYSAR